LDKSLLCDMPDADDREDILRALCTQLKVDAKVLGEGEQGTLKEVARRTEGYSGADLQAAVYNAQLEAIHDVLGDRDVAAKPKEGQVNGDVPSSADADAMTPDFTYFRIGDVQQTGTKDVGEPNESDSTATAMIPQTAAARATEHARIAALIDTYRRRLQLQLQQQRQTRHASRSHSHSHNIDHGDVNNGTSSNKQDDSSAEPTIEWRHILRSLAQTRASISTEERRRLAGIYREFVVGRNGEMPQGGEDGSREVGGRSSLM